MSSLPGWKASCSCVRGGCTASSSLLICGRARGQAAAQAAGLTGSDIYSRLPRVVGESAADGVIAGEPGYQGVDGALRRSRAGRCSLPLVSTTIAPRHRSELSDGPTWHARCLAKTSSRESTKQRINLELVDADQALASCGLPRGS